MPKQTRVGDIGVGYCRYHKRQVTVMFVSGSTSTQTDNKASCTVGSVGIADCGHTSVALSGSPSVTINNKRAHRSGDLGSLSGGGDYVAVSGSPNLSRD
jgi:uncharacterized Zn-binding protein involved in type VI secretion